MNQVRRKRCTRASRQRVVRLAVFCLLLGITPCLFAWTGEEQVQTEGAVHGEVVDGSGAAVVLARVHLVALAGKGREQEASTGADGSYRFESVPAGAFQIVIDAPGFLKQTVSGALRAGESVEVPVAVLQPGASFNVNVQLTPSEIADAQLHEEEKQRLFGVVPNFYVTYEPDAAPLNTRQKFSLAGKLTLDPVNFGIIALTAGVEQATDTFSGYGQGVAGYSKRYAAAYGDFLSGVFIGSAILPSLLHQDPRYFVKGTGTRRARILYAVANAVVRKGDNGRWQPDYSGILGGLASGGISNLYYPAKDRNGAALTFESAGLGIVGSAAGNLVQEFFLRKITPHAKPASRP